MEDIESFVAHNYNILPRSGCIAVVMVQGKMNEQVS